ncbi:uncharacterized protein EV154DRAFT_393790, partial [Mucor mucedo]|uniref:uncharacterized protein n=1 Tax=Mucor mucedo TaxID=29922 RepID=UPI00221E7D29
VIKASLSNICKNEQFFANIRKLSRYTTKFLFVGSLFANFVFIKLLGENKLIPVIEQSLFTNMFALLTGNGKRAPDYLKEYYTLFCESTTLDYESLKSQGYSSILSIAGKQYEVLV